MNSLKYFTSHDILGGYGENGVLLGQKVKTKFTHTQSLRAVTIAAIVHFSIIECAVHIAQYLTLGHIRMRNECQFLTSVALSVSCPLQRTLPNDERPFKELNWRWHETDINGCQNSFLMRWPIRHRDQALITRPCQTSAA